MDKVKAMLEKAKKEAVAMLMANKVTIIAFAVGGVLGSFLL